MSIWILIIVISGNGKGVTSQEFNSKQNCLTAGNVIMQKAKDSPYFTAETFCFKK